MQMQRPELLGPATTILDFDEGTKVRFGNTSVTLKGKFHREDATIFKDWGGQIEKLNKTVWGARDSLSNEGVGYGTTADCEQYGEIGARIRILIRQRDSYKSQYEAMCVNHRKAESDLLNFRQAIKKMRNTIIELGKDFLFGVIGVLADFENAK